MITQFKITAGLLLAAAILVLCGCGGGAMTSTHTTPPGGLGGDGAAPPSNSAPPSGNSDMSTFTNLHQQDGWTGYALLPSAYAICSHCVASGPEATWSMLQNVTSPAKSGNATRFDIGGQTKFADILWNNHLIGDFSSQGVPDGDHSLIPKLHDFVYDVYFYGTDLPLSQAVEFDINQFFDGKSFIWGHECRIASGHEWDVWDNKNEVWIPTGIPCNPVNKAWNHVTIEVQRTSDDRLLFKSITLNGEKADVNRYDDHTSAPGWHGVTINYQQDGNRNQDSYSIWLDQLNFSYR